MSLRRPDLAQEGDDVRLHGELGEGEHGTGIGRLVVLGDEFDLLAKCRFTLEPETGPIRVRSGTEIETDASLSLNLSANFVALSGESGLLFDCGLPGFDDGV